MPALERSKPPHARVRPLSVSLDGQSGPVLHRQHTAAQFESTRPTKHDRSSYRRLFHSSQYNTKSTYALHGNKASTHRAILSRMIAGGPIGRARNESLNLEGQDPILAGPTTTIRATHRCALTIYNQSATELN